MLLNADKHRKQGACNQNDNSPNIDIYDQCDRSEKGDKIAYKARKVSHRSGRICIGILHRKYKAIIKLGIVIPLKLYHTRLFKQIGLYPHMQLFTQLRSYIVI